MQNHFHSPNFIAIKKTYNKKRHIPGADKRLTVYASYLRNYVGIKPCILARDEIQVLIFEA